MRLVPYVDSFLTNHRAKILALAVVVLAATAWPSKARTTDTRRQVRERDQRGRRAEVPESIPVSGLRDVFWRVIHEVSVDRIMLIAAGVTFYILLATFPALAALVSLYGLIADPLLIADHLRALANILPPGSFEIVADQMKTIAQGRDTTLGITFFLSLSIALWSTRNGILAIFDAMNVAYDEDEKRGFIRLNLIGLAFTLCAIVGMAALIAMVAVLPAILSYLWLDGFQEQVFLILRWPFLLGCVLCAVTLIYRYGPSRQPARLRWLNWGAVLTTVAWLVMSIGFSFYLSHFADYNATYGALGTLIGLLMWIWLSVAILIVGAELNAELEHQTAMDTTTGPSRQMGARGAFVADTLGQLSADRDR